jgi:hypothetical protein
MEVTREFKPEALRSDEIVEVLYSLLLDDGTSLADLGPVRSSRQPTCFPLAPE